MRLSELTVGRLRRKHTCILFAKHDNDICQSEEAAKQYCIFLVSYLMFGEEEDVERRDNCEWKRRCEQVEMWMAFEGAKNGK